MKARKTMLGYSKTILKAVSFDRYLFEKEYRKALKRLTSDESTELKYWVWGEFIQPNLNTLK